MQIPQAFPEYAEKKLDAKLTKFFGDEADSKITVSEHKNQIILELTVKYNNMIYRAETKATDKNDALDSAVDKIIRQIRKNKTRLEKKIKRDATLDNMLLSGSEYTGGEETKEFEIVKTKRFTVKPMSSEEAILQMNLLGHTFFVFKNQETDEMNIVYKRKDGKYAIIESIE